MENLSPVFPNPLFALKQENLVVVAFSYSLRMDSAALTSFTKPDLSENWTGNKELTACRLSLLAIRETTILSSKPLNNCLDKCNRNTSRDSMRGKTLNFRNRSRQFSRLYLQILPSVWNLINQNLCLSLSPFPVFRKPPFERLPRDFATL